MALDVDLTGPLGGTSGRAVNAVQVKRGTIMLENVNRHVATAHDQVIRLVHARGSGGAGAMRGLGAGELFLVEHH